MTPIRWTKAVSEAEAPREEAHAPAAEQPSGSPGPRPVEPPTAPDPELENITERGRPPREGKLFP
jgi:hypothetical protein